MTRQPKDVYLFLEEFLVDKRKLKQKTRTGTRLTFMDQFVDDLLTKERVCATTLYKMPKREILEDLEVLEPRVSPLGDIEDLLESDVEEVPENGNRRDEGSDEGEWRSRSGSRSRSRSRSQSRRSESRDARLERSVDDMDVDVDKENTNGRNGL